MNERYVQYIPARENMPGCMMVVRDGRVSYIPIPSDEEVHKAEENETAFCDKIIRKLFRLLTKHANTRK